MEGVARGEWDDAEAYEPENSADIPVVDRRPESGWFTYHFGDDDISSPGSGTYTGEWYNFQMNGRGIFKFDSGGSYEGFWQDDRRHGEGSQTDDQGSYMGEWEDGMRHGEGTLTYTDGSWYNGQWADDRRHGVATYYDASKDEVFVGQFRDDKQTGLGCIRSNADGRQWVGIFDARGNKISSSGYHLLPMTEAHMDPPAGAAGAGAQAKTRDHVANLLRVCQQGEEGTVFLKSYAKGGDFFRGGRQRLVTFDEQTMDIVWSRLGKDDERKRLPLSEVYCTVKGRRTDSFSKDRKASSNEFVCLSILARDRTLDFVAPSVEVRDLWADGLSALLASINGRDQLQPILQGVINSPHEVGSANHAPARQGGGGSGFFGFGRKKRPARHKGSMLGASEADLAQWDESGNYVLSASHLKALGHELQLFSDLDDLLDKHSAEFWPITPDVVDAHHDDLMYAFFCREGNGSDFLRAAILSCSSRELIARLPVVATCLSETPPWLSWFAHDIVEILAARSEADYDVSQAIHFLKRSGFVAGGLFDPIPTCADPEGCIEQLLHADPLQPGVEIEVFDERFRHPFCPGHDIQLMTIEKVYSTAMRPVLLKFSTRQGGFPTHVLIKMNDDLRQDVACLQMFHLFNSLWDTYCLSFDMFPIRCRVYDAVVTGHGHGMIQFVDNCIGLGDIKSVEVASQWVGDQGQHRKQLVASAAAAFMGGYVLGIRDRHHDNILIDITTGHLFHIDFGFILGREPGLDTAAFAITSDLHDLIGDYWPHFVDSCVCAWRVLRNHEALISQVAKTLFSPLYPADQVEEHFAKSLWVAKKPGLALKRLRKLITEAPSSWQTKAKNQIHKVAVSLNSAARGANQRPGLELGRKSDASGARRGAMGVYE